MNSGKPAMVGAVAIGLGALSAVLLPGLGHDAWAWMIWAREIAHLELDTTTGSTIKPLPMLVMTPFGPFGETAPFLWLTLSRAAWVLIPLAAWKLGERIDGRRAATFAALGCVLVPVLFDSAVTGYSESLTALALLCAILALLANRPTTALGLIAVAGLMRPEAWPYAIAVAAWGVRSGRIRPATATIFAAGPFIVWAGLSWWGSGEPFGGATGTESIRVASGVVEPLLKGVAPVVGLGLLAALVLAIRDRDRTVLGLLAAGASWVVLVAAMAQIGFSGNPRYLVPAEVIAGVAAGWGLARAIGLLDRSGAQRAATALVGVAFAASLVWDLGFARDSVSRFESNARIASEMREAIGIAGGRNATLALGKPVVMNWSRRTALAWQLDVPITGTQVIWGPDWTGSLELPAILLASEPSDGNARAPLPRNLALDPLGRSGAWSVYRADRPTRR